MKRNLAPEVKVAGGGAAGAIVTIVLLLNGWQHWFTPPPAGVTAALTAALATVVAYVLPHTSRTPAQPVIHVTGDPSKQPAVIKFEGLQLTETDIERINAMLKDPHVQPHASQDDVTRAFVKQPLPSVPPAAPQPEGTEAP